MSETRRDRWGRYPGGGIVNRGGTCEHTDSLDDAMARLEQSLALSDELVGRPGAPRWAGRRGRLAVRSGVPRRDGEVVMLAVSTFDAVGGLILGAIGAFGLVVNDLFEQWRNGRDRRRGAR